MKRCPRDTFALRVAGCSLCPLALRQGPLTPPSSRQVARLPHDEPPQELERRFLSPRSPTRWDPGSGEKPGPTLEGERGGAAWGGGEGRGRPSQESGPFQRREKRSEERPVSVPGTPAALQSPGSAQVAALAAGTSGDRPRPSGAYVLGG